MLKDIDPLADTVPPRHAVESDDEEDEYNPLSTASAGRLVKTVDVKIVGAIEGRVGRALVVATSEAGKVWAKGAKLGEQSGGVMVNGVQVRSCGSQLF